MGNRDKELGYECPACRTSTLEVVSTTSYTNCILRTRHCMLCGHAFKTVEAECDVTRLMDVLLELCSRVPAYTVLPEDA